MKTVFLFKACGISAFLFFCASFSAFSQAVKKAAISGKVIENKTAAPLEYVAITLLTAKDSVTVLNSISNKAGLFSLANVANGNYILKLSFVGYKIFKRGVVIANNASEDIGTVILDEGLTLKDVTVQAEIIAVKVKTDTTEFNAAAFKAAPDATVEDGLKKLPGVEVDREGKIKANGEEITKITVDGKEFFGSDPKIATKNLPHDAVKSYQIIDDKTDKSKDSGIDDGKRSKTLNIVLKDDKKKGWFGNGSLAGGTEDRYLGSMSLNRFAKDKQFNVLMLSNNINQTGFTQEDATNFGGGSVSSSSMFGMNGQVSQTVNGVNVGSSNQGLTKTNSAGINFSDAWGKKNEIKFSGSYFGALSATLKESEVASSTTQGTGLYFDNNKSNNNTDNQSHRLNVRLTGTLDSLTNFTFTPTINLGSSNSNGSNTFAKTDSLRKLINAGWGQTDNHSFNPAFNGSLRITRRFHQKKGSYSLEASANSRSGSTDNIQQSLNTFYQSTRKPLNINRLENQGRENSTFTFGSTISRVISKDKKTSLILNPSISLGVNNTNRNTIEFNPLNGLYELRLDSLTNITDIQTNRYETSLGINRAASKWTLNIAGNLQMMRLKGSILGNKIDNSITKNYLNVLPEISTTYRIKPAQSLRISLSGYVNPPRLESLMKAQNNSSPFYISISNPDLKPSRSYSSYLSYNSSNSKKATYTSVSISLSKTFDASAQNTYFDKETGITRSQPVNVDGNYYMYAYFSTTIPTKIKNLRIGPGLNFNSSRNNGFLDGIKNRSDQLGAGGNINMNYSFKESFTIGVNNSTSYSMNKSSARGTSNNIWSVSNTGDVSYEPIKKWRLKAEVTNRIYAKNSVMLLNAGLQRFFMDKNKLSLELRAFDILNNNKDIYSYAYDNYRADTRTNSIGQYFYLKMIYRINKIGGSAPPRPAGSSVIIMR